MEGTFGSSSVVFKLSKPDCVAYNTSTWVLTEIWENMAKHPKFSEISDAIHAGLGNLGKWYKKTDNTDVYFICLSTYSLVKNATQSVVVVACAVSEHRSRAPVESCGVVYCTPQALSLFLESWDSVLCLPLCLCPFLFVYCPPVYTAWQWQEARQHQVPVCSVESRSSTMNISTKRMFCESMIGFGWMRKTLTTSTALHCPRKVGWVIT